MKRRYDEIFGDIAAILRRDYAGRERMDARFDPRYYNTAIGQAWHDGRLDELLFLRYVNQMLACTGDRHLRFSLRPSDCYEPWCCGFFTRRYEDSLYVTALRGETRLAPGDRITAVNGGTPAAHRARIQKDFFYGGTLEREDWNGLLKMADNIDVEHSGGRRERIELKRWPLRPVLNAPRVFHRPEGLLLDLRNVSDLTDEELMELLPLVCREDTPLGKLMDTEYYVNYTTLNCGLRAAGLADTEGSGEYLQELRAKAGQGFLPESADDDTIIPGRAKGPVVVLIDTWTRDGAEMLALAAKRAGALLVGRPTLGTIDYGGDVSLALDERYTLTWPTLITKAAREGHPISPLLPDLYAYIPWTPEELHTDIIMNNAVEELKGLWAWEERSDEPLGVELVMTAEEMAAFEREHPIPSQEEIERLLRETRDQLT